MTVPRRLSRFTAIAAAAATATTLLTGCQPGGGSSDAAGFDQSGRLTKLSVMLPLLGQKAPAQDGRIQEAIEEFAGVDLDITWVPGSNYKDRLTTTFASQDIPAIVAMQDKNPAFVQSAEAGAFWDLTDKVRNYPNLTPENEGVFQASTVNGTAYGVLRWRDPMRTAVTLRKDWLDKLGLEEPKSTDDLYRIAQAFTENDPDGNGVKDTYGLILASWNPLGKGTPYDAIETWHGAPNGWGEVDGKLVPSFTTEEFFEANRFLRKMVQEGLVNPDFATFDGANWNDPFFNGQAGIIIDTGSRAKKLLSLFKQKDPANYGSYVTMTGNLTGPDGELHALPTPGSEGVLAISKSAVRTDEQLDEVLKVLDKLSSEEGQKLLFNGIKGVTYNEADGYAEPILNTDEEKVMDQDLQQFQQFLTASNGQKYLIRRPSGEVDQALTVKTIETAKADLERAVRNPALPYLSKTQTERGAQLDTIVTDARAKYLTGQLSEDQLRSEIDRWFKEGGQQIVDEINELRSAKK